MVNPTRKADYLCEHFRIHAGALTCETQVKMSRAYINQLLSDIPVVSGDYKMVYHYEYWKYQSYWMAVLSALSLK